jgi:TRAF3-interacting protein 1
MVLRGEKPADGLRKDKKKQKPQKSDKPPPGDGGRDKGKEKPKVPSSKKPPSDRPQEDGEEGDPRKSSDAIKSASSQLVQSRSDLSGDKQKGGKEKKHRDKKEKRGKEKQGSEQPPQQEDPPLEDGEGQRSRKVDRKQDEDQEVVNSKDSPESQVAHTRPPSAKGGRKRQTNDEVPPSGPTINGPTSDEDKQEGRSEDIGVVPTTRERQSVKQDDPVDEAPSVPVAQEERPSTPPLPPMAIATQMKRPGSARPAPPRIVRHQPTQDVPVSVSTGSVSAPRVILDTEKNDDDEKFIVEETQLPEHHTLVQDPTMSDGIDRSTVGALARTMIETKERLEGSLGKDKTHVSAHLSTPAILLWRSCMTGIERSLFPTHYWLVHTPG